jgi:hypothetical protein
MNFKIHTSSLFRLVFIFLLFLASCSNDNSKAPQKFGGTWVMKLGQRTFLVVFLTENSGEITGYVARPEHFQVDSAGTRFSHVTLPEKKQMIAKVSIDGDHLHLLAENTKDKTDTDDYDLILTAKDQASFTFSDAPFAPWTLSRLPNGAADTVSKEWDPSRSYSPEDDVASNPEMKKIIDADQKARQDFANLSPEARLKLGRDDADRRRQTQELLAGGELHSAEDFRSAAFVFQHGSTPDDFLFAHTLASVAIAKGDPDALWIGAATLDRYLQTIGKPQIYGTQFKFKPTPNAGITQEPYNRELISDALRRQLGVPSQAAQQKQLDQYSEQFKAAGTKSK